MTKQKELEQAREVVKRIEEEIKIEQEHMSKFVKIKAVQELHELIERKKDSWTSDDVNSLISYIEIKEFSDKGMNLVTEVLNEIPEIKSKAQKIYTDIKASLTDAKQ